MTHKRPRLFTLFFPIFLELLLTMLTGAVDTLMLSSEGDQAVGAVGTANSYISIFLILFSIISSGMTAVMTQYIGAKRPGVAQQALRLGLLFNLSAGVVITCLLVLLAEPVLLAVGIAEGLLAPGRIYLQAIGCFCICNALIPIYSSYLRSFGHTSATLVGTALANVVNVLLNAVFLFWMDWGVLGVAIATGISRLLNLMWVWAAARRRIKPVQDDAPLPNREIFRKIIQVGLPAAMESSLYQLAMTIVMSLLNRMDAIGVQATARAYAAQITNFSFCAGAALAHANAIFVGWRIGAGELEDCGRETCRNALIAITVSVATACVIALVSPWLLPLFTDDPDMVRLVGMLLVVDIVLEIGRSSNLVFGFALKTSGDATYPMIVAITFAFLCAAGGTWLFGIRLDLLAVGAYIAMALDECVRAVFMFLRWKRGVWKSKILVKSK